MTHARWRGLAVALATFGIQALFVLVAVPGARQFEKYPVAAKLLLAGALPAERLADFSPLYLSLHAQVQQVLPAHPLFLQWVQMTAVALAGMMLFLVLEECAGLAAGVVGAVAFAFNRIVILYGYLYEPESLLMFFLVGAAFFLRRTGPRPKAVAGIFLGLALLTRPSFMPLAVLMPLYVMFDRNEGPARRYSAILLAAFPLGALLWLGARNLDAIGSFTPVAMNPGCYFFEGNNPLSSGKCGDYPPLVLDYIVDLPADQPDPQHVSYRVIARGIAGSNLSVSEVNRYWFAKAAHYILDYPGGFLRMIAWRTWLVFNNRGTHDLFLGYENERSLRALLLPTVPLGLMSAAALAALLSGKALLKRHFFFAAVFVNHYLVMVLTCVTDRQRVCAIPFFAYFAAVAFGEGRCWGKRPRASSVLVVCGIVLFSLPHDYFRESDALHEADRTAAADRAAALVARNAGRLEEATRLYTRAIARSPREIDFSRPSGMPSGMPSGDGDFVTRALEIQGTLGLSTPSALFDRAVLAIGAGRLDEAEACLRRLRADGRRFYRAMSSPLPEYHLARIAVLRGDDARAKTLLGEAIRKNPGDPFVLALQVALTGERRPRENLFRYYDEIDAEYLLGQALLDAHRPQEAAMHFRRVVALLPDYRRGRIVLAAALGEAGDLVGGANAFLEAVEKRPEPLMKEREITALFRNLAAARPTDGPVLFASGYALGLYGRFAEALAFQQRAARLNPDHAVAEETQKMEAALRALMKPPALHSTH